MFAERLKTLRKERGLTQEQLAEKIRVERSSVGKYEGKGKTIPSDDVKQRIAEFFDVSVDYLLGRTEIRNPAQTEKPTVNDDGLDEELVNLLADLYPPEIQRVKDFVAGLIAARAEDAFRPG